MAYPKAADSEESVGTPEDEIEMSPAVIDAGLEKLSPRVVIDLRDGWIRPSVVVESVFRAMLLVYRQERERF